MPRGISPFKLDTCKKCASRYDCLLSEAIKKFAWTSAELEDVAVKAINKGLFINMEGAYLCIDRIDTVGTSTAVGTLYSIDLNLDSEIVKNLREKYDVEDSVIILNENQRFTEISNINEIETHLN